MSEQKKPLPLILITIAITVPISITITYGLSGGLFNFLLPSGEFPLINGTIVGTDNKTYGVLVSSTETNPNLTLINTAVLDSNNKTFHVQIGKKITTPPTEPPVTCPPGTHLEGGVCVPDVVVPPQPQPTTKKIIVLGDVDNTNAGTSVFNTIKNRNPNVVAVLGDLGYDSNLNWFKSSYGSLGNKLVCVIGNHDAPEDGSSSIYTEAKQFCSSPYYFKLNKVLFVGVDTNGDLVSQASTVGKLFTNPFFMKNITSVHVMSHKPCAVPPSSEHAVESNVKTFCDSVSSKVPAGVKIFFDQAHNHIMSASGDDKFKQSGAGGRSHYSCPSSPSTAYPFCNDSDYGFLEYTIKPDGVTTYQFIDFNGRVLYSK